MAPRQLLTLAFVALARCVEPAPVDTPPPVPSVPVDADADADGVELALDACPQEPGLPPDGCPLRDADEDGILDPDDQCPDTPECINGFDDDDGCPDTVPEELAAILGVIEGLEFPPDQADILPASFPVLDHIVEVLARYPELQIEISGHVDSSMDSVLLRRRQPSRRRAEAVRDYLVHAGIPPRRLQAKGYGPDKPIASNETEEGKRQNRRVELEVVRPPWGNGAACEQTP